MKHIYTLIACLNFFMFFAQVPTHGVLLSINDFKSKQIKYVKNKQDNYCLKANMLFAPAKVKVKINNQKFTFYKDSIFGFVENEKYFRFYQKEQFAILNPSEKIIIYSKKVLPRGKGSLAETHYYFSLSADDAIEKLTIYNLKKAFSNNSNKIDLIDLYFKKESELIEFDTFNHVYKINHLLQ